MNIKNKILAFLELSKFRMVPMVLITGIYGFFLSERNERASVSLLIWTLLGMTLVSMGSAALNNYLERDIDAKMLRTRNRVLPSGRVTPLTALIFGISSIMAGVFLLVLRVNLLSGFLLLLAAFLYVLVYTPMKRWTWWNTFVGAIPGAIPPMAGWAAATGSLDIGAWVLFGILFTWQHPHFYAIALMHREDYKRGGLKMLPVIDPEGNRTFRQIIVYSILLILVSILPTVIGLAGMTYFIGALILGGFMMATGLILCLSKKDKDARRLFKASLVYLPMLLVLFVIDLGVF